MALYRQIGGIGDCVAPVSGGLKLQNPFSGYVSGVEQEFYGGGDYAVGNWFDDAFKFVQHNAAILGQQVPRTAFLGLVAVNAFGYATKLAKALQFDDSHAKLQDIWERVGGKFSTLVDAINSGAKKKALLKISNGQFVSGADSVGVLPAAALVAAAATIVAAIMPIISKLLDKHNANVTVPGIDPYTGMPVGTDTSSQANALNILTNPVVIAALVALGIYYLMD